MGCSIGGRWTGGVAWGGVGGEDNIYKPCRRETSRYAIAYFPNLGNLGTIPNFGNLDTTGAGIWWISVDVGKTVHQSSAWRNDRGKPLFPGSGKNRPLGGHLVDKIWIMFDPPIMLLA